MSTKTENVAGVDLTNPDRVLYPEGGPNKRELALYLEAVAKLILGHGGKGQVVLGKVLDQVLQCAVGHLGLVGPVRVAEDALKALRVRGLDGEEG